MHRGYEKDGQIFASNSITYRVDASFFSVYSAYEEDASKNVFKTENATLQADNKASTLFFM